MTTMTHRIRPAWAALALGTGAALWGCQEPMAPPAPPPPKVTVAKPEMRTVTEYFEFTGTTRAVAFAEVRARVSGSLDEMLFEPSVFVKENDVLFKIEPETYQAAHDEAEASLASAKSELDAADSDLERIEQAIKSNAVSEQDLDRARAQKATSEAAVLAAEARLAKAAIDLAYTQVRSPIPGQVSRNYVDVGNLVGYGEPTLLTTVTKIQPLHVYFQVPEKAVLRMLREQQAGKIPEEVRVEVATAGDEGYPHSGVVDYRDNTVDPTTGTIEVRASLPNQESLLFPGLFVRIRVLGPQGEKMLVDERALGSDLGGKFVLVVGDDDVVEVRYVTLGPVQPDGTVVVEEGLDGTERYITEGLLRARPGLPVDAEVAQD